eukprot:Tbor_TRINITY_DN5730_c3_g2::TRINITY_DN5730_c3_g2_i1::g.19915::m.19915/K15734/SDR16C5; all-trans-retinol dehydrogenase (NAD+)
MEHYPSLLQVYYLLIILILPIVIIYWIYHYFLYYTQRSIAGDTVLVTGGASGIGREMALQFAEEGVAGIVLWDVDEEGLERVRKEILSIVNSRSSATKCSTYIVDVSDRKQVYEAAGLLEGRIDILVNNAGVLPSGGKSLLDAPDEDIEKTIRVNTCAHMWTIKAFLPHMLAFNSGHIVTIASVASFCGGVGLSSYCASKFATFGLHESLEYELNHARNNNNTNTLGKEDRVKEAHNRIRTTVICPYIIDTGMFDGADPPEFCGLLSPLNKRVVGRRIVKAIKYGEKMVVIPWFLSIFIPFGRSLPYSWMVRVMVMIFGHSMDKFRGRGTCEKRRESERM